MRTVRPDGSLSDKPLDSSAATKWLQELLLHGDLQKAQVCKVTSHGLRATSLSWAAKWELGREQRHILGYHIVEGASSAPPHYNRDEQEAPLRALDRVYKVFVKSVSTQLLLGVATFEKGDGGSVCD